MALTEGGGGVLGERMLVEMSGCCHGSANMFSSEVQLPHPHRDPHSLPSSYLVTNLMGADLNNIVKFQKLSDEHVQFLIYQLLRGLKVTQLRGTRVLGHTAEPCWPGAAHSPPLIYNFSYVVVWVLSRFYPIKGGPTLVWKVHYFFKWLIFAASVILTASWLVILFILNFASAGGGVDH